MKGSKTSKIVVCECGLSPSGTCCRGIHSAQRVAETAEQLMRSRYTAYCLLNEPYLLATWHSRTRPDSLNLGISDSEHHQPTKWLGLEVRKHVANGDTATVEFVARFKDGGGPASRLHEISRFVREEGRWFYVDGDILP